MKSLHAVAAILAALSLQGCASTVLLASSAQTPGAQGVVKVAAGGNNNLRLKVIVHHLAPPDRLAPGAVIFVVWARPLFLDAPPQNLGALKVNRNLDGELDTLTPLHSFDLMITPELQGAVLVPSSNPVLSARVLRP